MRAVPMELYERTSSICSTSSPISGSLVPVGQGLVFVWSETPLISLYNDWPAVDPATGTPLATNQLLKLNLFKVCTIGAIYVLHQADPL